MSGGADVDVVIVGGGATGGWVAKQLTEGGLTVAVLEAGPDHPPATEPADGAEDAARWPVQSRAPGFGPRSRHLWVDDVDHPYTTAAERPFLWFRGRQVGGRTLLWGGTTLRLSRYELELAARDGLGGQWPFGYDELEPYYALVERYLEPWGTPCDLPQAPGGPYFGVAAMTEGERRLRDAVARRWPDRQVIEGRGIPDAPLAGAGPWSARTAQGTTLRAAAATGRLQLRPDTIVRQIEVDATGLARRAICLDRATRRESAIRGRAFVLCGSTIETIRLLLTSVSPQHPEGLLNSSGLVGRYFMDHPAARVGGNATGLPPATDPAGGPRSIYIPRFRNLDRREPGFARGYGVLGAVQRLGLPHVGGPQRDGDSGDPPRFLLSGLCEHLPSPDNRVVLDPEVVDQWGIPAPRIDCRFGDNERALYRDAIAEIGDMVTAAGFEVTHIAEMTTPGELIHECGGARMGSSPDDSVVDGCNRGWDCRNLFVADGSCWPSSACQNPTLTMMAIAARAADHLLRLARAGEITEPAG